MDDTARIASAHEAFVELLREIGASTLIGICSRGGTLYPPERFDARERTPKIEVSGLTKSARRYEPDIVQVIHGRGDELIEIWVFEVELSKDLRKRRTWAVYPVVYAAELDTDAQLAVFTPDPDVRRWYRARLIPRIQPAPLLIEPDQIELITDYEAARRRPLLAVLSAVYHAHGPVVLEHRIAAVQAAYVAIQTLPDLPARRYSVLIMSTAPKPVVEQALEGLRQSGDLDESRYELFSDTERNGYSFLRGREEGREEGRSEAASLLRTAVLDVLALRGFEVGAEIRERIDACDSLATFERWLAAVRCAAANQPVTELID